MAAVPRRKTQNRTLMRSCVLVTTVGYFQTSLSAVVTFSAGGGALSRFVQAHTAIGAKVRCALAGKGHRHRYGLSQSPNALWAPYREL